ncbi:MAG: glycosyltransferase family 2 protein [Bdellovibrionales bacterium]|nr:glycosyltransferase family 2 protein [Bdellovibrionales bacterium]
MKYSVVVPCYNEEAVLPVFLPRMVAAAESVSADYEIFLINDGSADLTWSVIKEACAANSRIKGICLSRNFGHQLAVTAGLSYCSGERTLIIDADLQDPPELIKPMSEKMDEGFDVVFGKRKAREGETFFKKFTAAVFYRILKSMTSFEIPVDAGDFRLINKRVLDVLQAMPERDRYLRGMVAWVGGKQVGLEYDRDERAMGETKYTFKKMLKLAIDGITAFSTSPLRIATSMSFFAAFLSLLAGGYVLYSFFFLDVVRGWSSMMAVVSILFAMMFFCMGIMGEYIGRIFEQVKSRPMFLVSEAENVSGPRAAIAPKAQPSSEARF